MPPAGAAGPAARADPTASMAGLPPSPNDDVASVQRKPRPGADQHTPPLQMLGYNLARAGWQAAEAQSPWLDLTPERSRVAGDRGVYDATSMSSAATMPVQRKAVVNDMDAPKADSIREERATIDPDRGSAAPATRGMGSLAAGGLRRQDLAAHTRGNDAGVVRDTDAPKADSIREERATIEPEAGSKAAGPLSPARAAHAVTRNRHTTAVYRVRPADVDTSAAPDTSAFAQAVARFQAAHGLVVNGIVGPKTAHALHKTGRHVEARAASRGDGAASAVPAHAHHGQMDVLEDGVLGPDDVLEDGVLGPDDVLEDGLIGQDNPMFAQGRNRQQPGTRSDQLESGLIGEAVQRKGAGEPSATPMPSTDVPAIAGAGVSGSGQRLPYLDRIQASFGDHDVTGVQAHIGGAAGDAAKQIGAVAYATGDHVAFDGAPDLHTTAHEAAHAVQQRSGAGLQLKGGLGQVGDAHEQHADAVADKVVRGESAEALLGAYAATPADAPTASAVQRQPATTAAVQGPAISPEMRQEWTAEGKPLAEADLPADERAGNMVRIAHSHLIGDCGAPDLPILVELNVVPRKPVYCSLIKERGRDLLLPPPSRETRAKKKTEIKAKPTGVVGQSIYRAVVLDVANKPIARSQPVVVETHSRHEAEADLLERQLASGADKVDRDTTEGHLVQAADEYVAQQTGRNSGKQGIGSIVADLRADIQQLRTAMHEGYQAAVNHQLKDALDNPASASSFGVAIASDVIKVLAFLVPEVAPAAIAAAAKDVLFDPAGAALALRGVAVNLAGANAAQSALSGAIQTGMGRGTGVTVLQDALGQMTNAYCDALKARVAVDVSHVMGQNPARSGADPQRYMKLIGAMTATRLFGAAVGENGEIDTNKVTSSAMDRLYEQYILHSAVLETHGRDVGLAAMKGSNGGDLRAVERGVDLTKLDLAGKNGARLAVHQLMRAAADVGCALDFDAAERALAEGPDALKNRVFPVRGFNRSVLFNGTMPTRWFTLISDGVLRPEPFFDNAPYASFDDGIQITGISVDGAKRHGWLDQTVLSLERLSLTAVAAPVHERPLFSDGNEPEPPRMIPVTVPGSFTIAYRFK